MSPESFDRSKTDLQSLFRSGTWLYQCGQGPAPFANAPHGSSPFNVNDLNLHNDNRTLDQIDFCDVESADFPLNTFNFEPSEHQGDRPAQEYESGQGKGQSSKQEKGRRDRTKGQWRWILWVLGVVVPVGLLKGMSGFTPMPLPQSASSLSTAVPPVTSNLEGETAPVDSLDWATQAANQATALVSTAQTPADWQGVATLWQDAINFLAKIPATDPQYDLAQNRMVSYRSQLDYATAQWQSLEMASKVLAEQDEIFRGAVRAALTASELTQTARTQQEWQSVAKNWQTAIDGMSQISVQSPHYATAQDRISTYTHNLNYAQRNAHGKLMGL